MFLSAKRSTSPFRTREAFRHPREKEVKEGRAALARLRGNRDDFYSSNRYERCSQLSIRNQDENREKIAIHTLATGYRLRESIARRRFLETRCKRVLDAVGGWGACIGGKEKTGGKDRAVERTDRHSFLRVRVPGKDWSEIKECIIERDLQMSFTACFLKTKGRKESEPRSYANL